jgi:hypothetical protein
LSAITHKKDLVYLPKREYVAWNINHQQYVTHNIINSVIPNREHFNKYNTNFIPIGAMVYIYTN